MRDRFVRLQLILFVVLVITMSAVLGFTLKGVERVEKKYDSLYQCYQEMSNGLIYEQGTEITPINAYTEAEVYVLAQCVEAEAGRGNSTSQKYITQVILNRVNSNQFPNTIEGVIYQKNKNIPQFSVAYNGMMNITVQPETLANVYSVLLFGTNLPENVMFFYSSSVKNNWVNTLKVYTTVEGTVFAYQK